MYDDSGNSLAAKEAYLLLLLSDANLPTGSFVASSGLESYIKHGFFSDRSPESPFASSSPTDPQPPRATVATVNFLRDSLKTYSQSTLAFIRSVYEAMERDDALANVLAEIVQLDGLYETMTLNHAARRASKAQGVALLSLYTKGFSRPSWLPDVLELPPPLPEDAKSSHRHQLPHSSKRNDDLVEELKALIRRGDTPGHLPICWAVLSASLGLSTERSQYLHIFLHARALLSASVRLNTVGPYASQQLLLHVVKPLVDDTVKACKDIRLRFVARLDRNVISGSNTVDKELADGKGADSWELDEDADENGPASTWPLGEILAGRHDLQHSRIFNS
ncbi:hypothetical protein FRB94_007535 [Tulasnella sp. JGI-2019a]|nr:hypothetical protein FRB94_007535 [Tulasnella sp. JGI-2019a]